MEMEARALQFENQVIQLLKLVEPEKKPTKKVNPNFVEILGPLVIREIRDTVVEHFSKGANTRITDELNTEISKIVVKVFGNTEKNPIAVLCVSDSFHFINNLIYHLGSKQTRE